MDQILSVPAEAGAVSALPRDVGALCGIVQGLLVHDAAVAHLYGAPPPGLTMDRTTYPVSKRLERAIARCGSPISVPRPVSQRQVGTCRDFAAMLCVFLRHAGYQAQVRCGFAAYFTPQGLEDHWVTAYRRGPKAAWHLADAQLDEVHRRHHGIAFDVTDMPEGAFLTADRAWRRWRRGEGRAGDFRHGDHRGAGLLLVNLMRDALARRDRLTSCWDGWRGFGDLSLPLGATAQSLGDSIAAGGEDHIASLDAADPGALFAPADGCVAGAGK
ncbi:MAG: transglutaminase domain-containing protein [Pseudomonadota bacterium]